MTEMKHRLIAEQLLCLRLVAHDINFDFRSTNGYQFVYVHGFKDGDGYRPEIRISVHTGKEGYYVYYVKNCGIITENASLDDVMEMIGELLCFDK